MTRTQQTEREATRALTRCACFNLRKATRAVTQLYDERLREAGLRTTQLSLLTVIQLQGKVTVSELAERAVTDRTTLTRNLQLMSKRGWIRIQPGQDRRVREVELTPRGLAMMEKALPLWERAQAEVTGALGGKRFERLLSDLSATVAVAQAE
jgi:DNA-binding MarR family transcriptional regulator